MLWQWRTGQPAGEGREAQRAAAVPVTVATARSGTIRETIAAIGTLEAEEMVTLTSEVRGKVEAVAFREGDRVEQGQSLVRLDADEIRAQLERARAVREEALRQYERAQALDTGEYITAAEVDRRRRAYQTAEAEVKQLEARLDEYTIVAPFSGRIGLRQVSRGSLVEPGTIIASMSTVDPIELHFEVPAELLPTVGPGTAVVARVPSGALSVKVNSNSEASFQGEVVTIDSDVDPDTRTIELVADVPNPEGLLRPGMFMAVEVVIATRSGVILVPEEAVLLRGTDSFVFRVEDGKLRRVAIKTGIRKQGEVEVRSGLGVGDRVVTGDVENLKDGQDVRITADQRGDVSSVQRKGRKVGQPGRSGADRA